MLFFCHDLVVMFTFGLVTTIMISHIMLLCLDRAHIHTRGMPDPKNTNSTEAPLSLRQRDDECQWNIDANATLIAGTGQQVYALGLPALNRSCATTRHCDG